MKVRCSNCGTEYHIPEKIVKGKKRLKLKCAKCREIFVVPVEKLLEEKEIEDVLKEVEEKREEIKLEEKEEEKKEIRIEEEEPKLEELEKQVEEEEEKELLETIEKLKEERSRKAKRVFITNIIVFIIVAIIDLGGLYLIKNPLLLSSVGFAIKNVKPHLWDCADGNVFLVEGVVVNKSRIPKRYVKLKVILYGKDGKVIATGTGYAGIIFAESEVKNLDKNFLKKALTEFNPSTQDYYRVPREGEKPFMVPIFSGFDGGKSFKVQIVEAPNV